MPEQPGNDRDFIDQNDALAQIRAAVSFLLRGRAYDARADVINRIMAIVNDAARGETSPLDEGMPGG